MINAHINTPQSSGTQPPTISTGTPPAQPGVIPAQPGVVQPAAQAPATTPNQTPITPEQPLVQAPGVQPVTQPPTGSSPQQVTPPASGTPPQNKILQKKKKRKPPKSAIIGSIVMLLLVIGGFAGFLLMNQSQDIRQQAASEEVTNTEMYSTDAEWQQFNQKWQDFLAKEPSDWTEFVAFSQGDGARYTCDAKIMTVGEETLYGCDLNALFALTDNETYIQPNALDPQDQNLNSVLDKLITNSGLLQTAQQQELLTLDDSFFNNQSKNTETRYAKLREVRRILADRFEKTVDYEAIAIYFHNQVAPNIPLDQAQAAAEEKMNVLYQRLQNGDITMEQAGEEIKNDAITGDTTGVSLSQLDSLFRENAYVKVSDHSFNSSFFKDSVYDEELRSLGEGQMSTVRVCKDYVFDEEQFQASITGQETEEEYEFKDSCYMIFKVNEIDFGLAENSSGQPIEEFINQQYQAVTEKNL